MFSLPLSAKLHIYNSLILSHLKFCTLACGYKCDRIVKLQNQLVEFLASANTMHTEPIFKRLKLLKVSNILIMQELNFIINS